MFGADPWPAGLLGLLIASGQAQVVCHIQQMGVHLGLIFLMLTCPQEYMAVDLVLVSVMTALPSGFGRYSWPSGIVPRRNVCSPVVLPKASVSW